MPRPKSILWVDDEIEALAPHRRFLETQGFTVASAAHGDDALAMLRRQPYSVVLLDEQMPGRRGLELLPEIRAIDAGVPVVMVTQSEDDGTLRDAIGVEVDDYLVKPVHPRQILSVVTRLLEGERIRQQRLARDFVARLRELEGPRRSALAWPASIHAGWRVPRATARPSRWTWAPSSSCRSSRTRGGCCSSSSTACGSTSGTRCATSSRRCSTSRSPTTTASCRPRRRSRATPSSPACSRWRSPRAIPTGGAKPRTRKASTPTKPSS